ncbi:MAG: hypothetical protein WCK65_10480 [Rhodospirillaceae bacterium]
MELNSLDAQREAGENYIASQKAEGWLQVPDRYDDGGFSGGNLYYYHPVLQYHNLNNGEGVSPSTFS